MRRFLWLYMTPGCSPVKEINRLKILQDVIDHNLRPGQAAEMPGITPRHCNRLLKRYRQLGPLGMSNHSRGRAGNRLLPTSLIDQALRIIREHYRDLTPRWRGKIWRKFTVWFLARKLSDAS